MSEFPCDGKCSDIDIKDKQHLSKGCFNIYFNLQETPSWFSFVLFENPDQRIINLISLSFLEAVKIVAFFKFCIDTSLVLSSVMDYTKPTHQQWNVKNMSL